MNPGLFDELFCEVEEIFSVIVFSHGLGDFCELGFGNPTLFEGNLLETSHFEPLTFFDDLNRECFFVKEDFDKF